MSDLFTSAGAPRQSPVYVTRDLRGQDFIQELKNTGFEIVEFEDSRASQLEQAIVVSYPGKGRALDEKIPASTFLVILDADDTLERLMSKRCFFIESKQKLEHQLGLFEALEKIIIKRQAQAQHHDRLQGWEEQVQEALSGFDYLIKSLSRHLPDDVEQDEGVADLLDFFIRVLALKERSVSITSQKNFWEVMTSTFKEFDFKQTGPELIPVGQMPWTAKEKSPSKYALLKVMGLAFLMAEFTSQSEVFQRQKEEENLWEEALNHLPYPVALISSSGDLVAHNAAFTQLSIFPVDCLKLRSQQKVETAQGVYRVQRTRQEGGADSDSSEQLLLFMFRDDGGIRTRSNSGEELGIISSSIAHELNNPLAGILASLTVIALEEDLPADTLQALNDMKTGARRCKELVEIFLGFSRATPRKIDGVTSALDAFDKALSLSRFRMIESNLRLDITSSKIQQFQRELNTSILAMVCYLILGEIMTASSHHQLVTERSGACVRGRFVEKENAIELSIEGKFPWCEEVMKSKLIQHLIELAGLSILRDDDKLILRDWTLV